MIEAKRITGNLWVAAKPSGDLLIANHNRPDGGDDFTIQVELADVAELGKFLVA